jgi:transcriptional regulator with XRE-family HTH domain
LLRRQLGRFLRERRLEAGFTIARAAEAVQLSPSTLQRLETGQPQKLRKEDVRALCELYGVDPEETEKAVGLAVMAAENPEITALGGMFSNAFNMYVDMEIAASNIISYQEVVPGLLQTANYARALIGTYPSFGDPDEIEKRLQVRLKRQAILKRRREPLNLEVILNQSALHRTVGNARIMGAQCRELAEVGKLPNVTIRILPYTAGFPWGIVPGQFVILNFGLDRKGNPVEPPVIYRDGGMSSDIYLDHEDDIRHYYELVEALRRDALDTQGTRDLLRQVAREYDRDR